MKDAVDDWNNRDVVTLSRQQAREIKTHLSAYIQDVSKLAPSENWEPLVHLRDLLKLFNNISDETYTIHYRPKRIDRR